MAGRDPLDFEVTLVLHNRPDCQDNKLSDADVEISYRNYTNGSARFGRGYEPGDTLIAGWAGTITLDKSLDVFAAAERVWLRHNRDDRPDRQLCPSMSVGDVVVLGETALTVEQYGFSIRTIDTADVIADRSWREWIAIVDTAALPTH